MLRSFTIVSKQLMLYSILKWYILEKWVGTIHSIESPELPACLFVCTSSIQSLWQFLLARLFIILPTDFTVSKTVNNLRDWEEGCYIPQVIIIDSESWNHFITTLIRDEGKGVEFGYKDALRLKSILCCHTILGKEKIYIYNNMIINLAQNNGIYGLPLYE